MCSVDEAISAANRTADAFARTSFEVALDAIHAAGFRFALQETEQGFHAWIVRPGTADDILGHAEGQKTPAAAMFGALKQAKAAMKAAQHGALEQATCPSA